VARPSPKKKASARSSTNIGEGGGEFGLKEDTDITEKGGGRAGGYTKKVITGPGAEASSRGAKHGRHHGGKAGFGSTSPDVGPKGRGKK